MAILSATGNVTGLSGVLPNIIYLNTNDTAAAVIVSGYLNHIVQTGGISVSKGDMALVNTTTGPLWLAVSITGTGPLTYSLVTPTNEGSAIFQGNVQAGSNGIAGEFISYPTTASEGTLIVSATSNASGNFGTTITNAAAVAQAQVISIPDSGAAAASFVVAPTGPARMKAVHAAAVAGGAAAQTVTDAYCTTTSVVIANWASLTNACEIEKIVPGAGSFVVTSTADPGASTLSYIIIQ